MNTVNYFRSASDIILSSEISESSEGSSSVNDLAEHYFADMNRTPSRSLSYSLDSEEDEILKEKIDIPSVEQQMIDIVILKTSLAFMRIPAHKGIFANHILGNSSQHTFVELAFYHQNIDAIHLLREFKSPFLKRIPKLVFNSIEDAISRKKQDELLLLRSFIFKLIQDDVKGATNLLRYFLVEHRLYPFEGVLEKRANEFLSELFHEIRTRYMINSKLILLDVDSRLFTSPSFVFRAHLLNISQGELKNGQSSYCLLL